MRDDCWTGRVITIIKSRTPGQCSMLADARNSPLFTHQLVPTDGHDCVLIVEHSSVTLRGGFELVPFTYMRCRKRALHELK